MSADIGVCHTLCLPNTHSKMDAMSESLRRLNTTDAQGLAWRSRGPADAPTWLVLHGGPGSGGNGGVWAPVDARHQRAVMPDQRGSGASRPRGGLRGQNLRRMVRDIEALREQLGLAHWHVLGGSWGAVLALAYAQAHPGRVQSLVLRGAFAMSRAEIAGVLMPSSRWVKTLGALGRAAPCQPRLALPAVLAQRVRLLQSATVAVASLRACRVWSAMENRLAAHGQRRAVLHAPHDPALRRTWAATQRAWRRQLARANHPRADRRDRQAWRKFRIQAHVLQRRGGWQAAALDRAVIDLAGAGVPMHWLHGDFDAICPPRNSRRWTALGQAHGGAVQHTRVHSGHLSVEPAMARALRAAVRPVQP